MTCKTTGTDNATILLFDINQTEKRALSSHLEQIPYHINETNSLEHAFALLRESDIHLFILYQTDDTISRTELITQIRQLSPQTEIMVVISDADDKEISNMYQAGAFDVLVEPVSVNQMLGKVQRALEHYSLHTECTYLQQQIAMNYSYDSIIGISPVMQEVKKTIRNIAPTDIAVLITGATGTGKSFLAQVLHHHSNRRHGNIVTVDCSIFQDESFSQCMWGSKNNDILQRDRHNIPAVKAAVGGTLILENIQSLSLSSQEKLLHFLRTGSPDITDIRLITTADSTLSQMVQTKAFHHDLLDRLGVITIDLPPLRERLEDFELLVVYFLRKIANEHHWETLTIQKPVIEILQQYHWHGNIRELEDTLRQAALLQSDRQITIDTIVQVNSDFMQHGKRIKKITLKTNTVRLEENQRELIEKALNDNNWNFTQTAQELGIGRTTLWRKIKKYNLKRTPIPT